MEMRALDVQYQINGIQGREINLNKRIEEKKRILKSVTNNIDYWQAASQCTDKLEAEEKDLEGAVRRRKQKLHEVEGRLAGKIARSAELQAQRGHIAKALS